MTELELDQHLLDLLDLTIAVIELVLRLGHPIRHRALLLHVGHRRYPTLLHSLLMLIELFLNGVSLHVHFLQFFWLICVFGDRNSPDG